MKTPAYTAIESREITEFLHLNIIERLLQESSWVYKDIVFQGGTSLHLAWRSPRFSEDLDFLLSEDREKEIVKILSRTAKKLSADMKTKYGGDLELKQKGERNGLLTFNFKYSHPEKRGKIFVKTEFLKTNQENINRYESVAKDMDSDYLEVSIRPYATVSSLPMLYADKVLAIVQRPYLKPRDYFDLWWIRKSADLPAHTAWKDEFLEKLEVNFSIYKTDGVSFVYDLGIKIQAKQSKSLNSQQLSNDLKNWLPLKTFQVLMSNNAFEDIEKFVKNELISIHETVKEHYLDSSPSL